VSRDAAREKISHFFRHLRAKTVAEKEESVSVGIDESMGKQSSLSVKRVTAYESSSPAHSISTFGDNNSNNNDQEETLSPAEEVRSKCKKQFRETNFLND
jgi:hypothetical protein